MSDNWSSVALPHTKAIIRFPQVCTHCLMDYGQMESTATVPWDAMESEKLTWPWYIINKDSLITAPAAWRVDDAQPEFSPYSKSFLCDPREALAYLELRLRWCGLEDKGKWMESWMDDSLIRHLKLPLFTEHHRFLILKLDLHYAIVFLCSGCFIHITIHSNPQKSLQQCKI